MIDTIKYNQLSRELTSKNVTLVAVSKTKPVADIQALYDLGQRDFGENYVQELVEKQPLLPNDIRWHFIGHLQSNKVRYIAPFVHLIQSADSEKLLAEINKQAKNHQRKINCLLQVHIAAEETKFGFDENELQALINQSTNQPYAHVNIRGLMGMSTFTENKEQVKSEFRKLQKLYESTKSTATAILNLESSTFNLLSMGMSDDYELAIECGSNMVRIGSLLFGKRS